MVSNYYKSEVKRVIVLSRLVAMQAMVAESGSNNNLIARPSPCIVYQACALKATSGTTIVFLC